MRYKIWDKTESVITPSGEVFTAEEWADRYPMSRIPSVKIVISGGTINGAFCGEFDSMRDMYEHEGCDFSSCENDREVLDLIEAWEDIRNMPTESDEPTAEDIIASSLAFLAMAKSYELN